MRQHESTVHNKHQTRGHQHCEHNQIAGWSEIKCPQGRPEKVEYPTGSGTASVRNCFKERDCKSDRSHLEDRAGQHQYCNEEGCPDVIPEDGPPVKMKHSA